MFDEHFPYNIDPSPIQRSQSADTIILTRDSTPKQHTPHKQKQGDGAGSSGEGFAVPGRPLSSEHSSCDQQAENEGERSPGALLQTKSTRSDNPFIADETQRGQSPSGRRSESPHEIPNGGSPVHQVQYRTL